MPGSCDSEQDSSPSLISSLRKFRFQNKAKQSPLPETLSSNNSTPTYSSNNSTPSQSSNNSAKSSKSKSNSNIGVSSKSVKSKKSPDPPLSQKSPASYNPLSYRKYENTKDSVSLLHNISEKIQASLQNNNTSSVLEFILTFEEIKLLKDTVLQKPSVSVKWSTNVTEYAGKESNDKLLKIKQPYVFELSKYIEEQLNSKIAKNNSTPVTSGKQLVRTYSRVKQTDNTVKQTATNNTTPVDNQTQGAMDDYEEFCEKEQCLRKLLEAFPGADIMEAQDILVKCQWNLKKAMIEAQNQPLRTTRKRGFPGNNLPPPAVNPNNQGPIANTQQTMSLQKKVPDFPEEIVLDSSDEDDEVNGKSAQMSDTSGTISDPTSPIVPAAKRARHLISTDSEDEVASAAKSPISASYQKSHLSVLPVQQKPSTPIQALPRTSMPKVSPTIQKPPPLVQNTSKLASVQNTVKSAPVQNSLKPSFVQNTVKSAPVQNIPKPAPVQNAPKPSPVQNTPKSAPVQNVSKPATMQNASKPAHFLQNTKHLVSTSTTSQSSSSSEKSINVPQALSIKPVPVSSTTTSVAVSSEKTSSAMPSLPKGLVITQVGGAENSTKKLEKEESPINGSHRANIQSNTNKSAQLVRIKPSSNISSNSSNQSSLPNSSSNAVMNTSANTMPVNIPKSKGVSITPLSQAVNIPKNTPKTISITPVSNVTSKDSLAKEKSPTTTTSSTEEEPSPDIKSKKPNQRRKNAASLKILKEVDVDGSIKSTELDKPQKRKFKRSVKNEKKTMAAKRRRYCGGDDDDDDDEEYGNQDIYDSEDSDCEEKLTPAHTAVLKFFQDASPEELGSIPGCSKKKIETVIKYRPFTKWLDLVEKLRNDKALSTDLLNGAKKVLDMRHCITKLMTKCQRISLDMGDLVENLKENRETSSDYVSKQPDLINERMHLTAYQMLGLNWLLLMHNQQVNAILADEMGLGKTVQAISFLAYLKQIEEEGPHLIVVPSSTLDNWRKELEVWWPTVSVICYHGQQETRRELRMQILNDEVEEFDVMITTYNMVTSSAEDRNFFKRLEFNYVIFDEAHMLKNMASQRYTNLMRIKAPRRLLLTGTPLQNNLVELMSLLIFAMPHMFSGKIDQIKAMFSTVSKTSGNKNTYEKDRIEHAKHIMKPFVLRRLKRDVLKELPNKHDETRFCPMVEDQFQKYEELIKKFSAQVESTEEKDPSSSGAGMMMQLRRAANHPLLLRRIFDDDKLLSLSKLMLKEPTHNQSDPNIIFEDMAVMSDFELHKLCFNYKSIKSFCLPDSVILNSGKFKVLEELLPTLIKEDHRILLFSQFTMVLDIVQEYMNIKEYKYLRLDGQTPVPERQQLIDDFNNDPEILVFLLSTKAGGLGINLTAADTVILHDIDFNPYNDKQAEDRCHRVGQVRDVRVIRLISEKTIEEGILQRAKEKLKLEKDIHDEGDNEENDTASVAMLLRDALGLKAAKS